MARLENISKIHKSIDLIVNRLNNYIGKLSKDKKIVKHKNIINNDKTIVGRDKYIVTIRDIINRLYSNEKAIDKILENSLESIHLNLEKYIFPIEIFTGIYNIDDQIHTINRLVKHLYVDILRVKTIDDVRKFLNRLLRLKKLIYKCRIFIFNFIYIDYRSTIKTGGANPIENPDDTIDSSRKILDSVINYSLKNLLNDINELEKILDTPQEKKGCGDHAQMILDEYKNYIYYQSILEKLEDLLQIESNKIYLDDLQKEEWFKNIDTLKTNHNWISQKLLSEKLDDETSAICKKIISYNDKYNSLLLVRKDIVNTYEDIRGSVRVYLRLNEICKPSALKCIKNLPTNRTNINQILDINIDKNYIRNNNTGETYSGFYSIFNNKYGENSNKLIYNEPLPGQEPLKGIFDLLRDGYSNFLFGYGFSGSCKSYSLFGSKDTMGIVQYGIADLLADNYNVSLKYAFDIYGQISYGIANGLSIHSNIVTYKKIYSEDPFYKRFNRYIQDGNVNNKPVKENIDTIEDINNIVSAITDIRIANRNIKATINNPESSRGHLFLTFEIEKDGTRSFLNIIDMAGIEDPIKIVNFYLEPKTVKGAENNTISYIIDCISKPTEIHKQKLVWQKKYEKYTNDEKKNIYEILREGFFINETLHHLKHYLLKKQNKKDLGESMQTDLNITKDGKIHFRTDKYNTQNLFIDTESSNKEVILMNPVLEFLESLSKYNMTTRVKPSKFIMLSVIRSNRIENNEVLFLRETLDFTKKMLSVDIERSDGRMATPPSSPMVRKK